MDARFGLLFLFVLGASWACDARQLANTENPDLSNRNTVVFDMLVKQISYQGQERKSKASEYVSGNENVCSLCEEFATKAIDYLSENTTQTVIIDILHLFCSQVSIFKKECIALVDYYVPLFFLEISSVQPAEFCQKVDLCELVAVTSQQLQENSCEVCHLAVAEILVKLKDPDTQLEIIELLLKGCNSIQNYVKKCKRIVFEYGPLILANAEQFLETTDICTMLHACNLPTSSSKQDSSKELLSDS